MEKKKIYILAGVFLALLVVVLILEKPYKNPDKKANKTLIKVDSQKVGRITIRKKEEETVLIKKGDQWVVENKNNFPADPDAIEEILKQLENLETVKLVSKNPEKANIFETNADSGIEVKAEGEGVKKIHFYVGKNGPDFNSNYIRREGSDEIYLSAEFIRRFVDRPDFRSKKIFDLKKRTITRLYYKFPDREIELVKTPDDTWKQLKGEPYNAQKEIVEALVNNLKSLKIDEFVDQPDEKKFENLQLELSFNCEDGYENTLVIARETKGEPHTFVKTASKKRQYKIIQYQIKRLTDKLKDLKEIPAEEKQEEKQTEEKDKAASLPPNISPPHTPQSPPPPTDSHGHAPH